MALLTLAEAERRSLRFLDKAIYETLINEGEILPMIPFKPLKGVSYDYLRESTLPASTWAAVDATISSDNAVTTNVAANTFYLYSQFDMPHVYIDELETHMDQVQTELRQAVKSLIRNVNDIFFYGDFPANSDQPPGLHRFLASNTGQLRRHGTADTTTEAPSVTSLDAMLRLVKGGDPSLICMDRPTHDSFKRYWDSLTSSMAPIDAFGRKMPHYGGIPILRTDYISSTEDVDGSGDFLTKTGSDGTTIFAIRFGEDAVHGIAPMGMTGAMGWKVVKVADDLEDKDSTRYRIKWYLNPLVVKSTLSVAGVTGITSGGTWVA